MPAVGASLSGTCLLDRCPTHIILFDRNTPFCVKNKFLYHPSVHHWKSYLSSQCLLHWLLGSLVTGLP